MGWLNSLFLRAYFPRGRAIISAKNNEPSVTTERAFSKAQISVRFLNLVACVGVGFAKVFSTSSLYGFCERFSTLSHVCFPFWHVWFSRGRTIAQERRCGLSCVFGEGMGSEMVAAHTQSQIAVLHNTTTPLVRVKSS